MAGPRRDPTNRFFPMTGSKVPLSPTTGTEQAFSQPDSLANILPPHLRAEQPTILAAKYGEVTNAAQQLCLIANRLGRKYGVHGAPFFYDKEEVTPADADNNHWLLKAFAEFSMAFYGRMPYLQITLSSKIDWVVF